MKISLLGLGLYAPIRVGDVEYYINSQGDPSLAVDSTYENLGIFSQRVAPVSVKGTYGYLDRQSHHSDFLWDYTGPIYNGMGAVQKDGKWALVNSNLKELTEYCYDDIARNEFGICSAQAL